MLVGRLAGKDVERGTFLVQVDAVSRVWRNSRAENPQALVGKAVEVNGVTGKWLDVLVVTRKGETLEFECQHDGERLRFPGEMLRKVAPYRADDYPRLTDGFRGFQGVVVADVLKKDSTSLELMVKVRAIKAKWPKNGAKAPESMVGKNMLMAGFWNRREIFNGLKPGDRVEAGLQHMSRQSDHLNVAESVRKLDGAAAKMERKERMGARGTNGFRGMLVGRIVKKDIERGEFSIEVDAVPRVWQRNQLRNPKSLIGKQVRAHGVAGKQLDPLIVSKIGDTIEFGALSDGEEDLRVVEVLRRVAPVKPGDYPALPEGANGLNAMLTGKVVKKDSHLWSLIVQVESVEVFQGNGAKEPKAIVGKPVMVGGFWRRQESHRELREGDIIRFGVKHEIRQSDLLNVVEGVKKVGAAPSESKSGENSDAKD